MGHWLSQDQPYLLSLIYLDASYSLSAQPHQVQGGKHIRIEPKPQDISLCVERPLKKAAHAIY